MKIAPDRKAQHIRSLKAQGQPTSQGALNSFRMQSFCTPPQTPQCLVSGDAAQNRPWMSVTLLPTVIQCARSVGSIRQRERKRSKQGDGNPLQQHPRIEGLDVNHASRTQSCKDSDRHGILEQGLLIGGAHHSPTCVTIPYSRKPSRVK